MAAEKLAEESLEKHSDTDDGVQVRKILIVFF